MYVLPRTHPYTDRRQRIPLGPTGLQGVLPSWRHSRALVLLVQQTRLLVPQRRRRRETKRSVNRPANVFSRHFWRPFCSGAGNEIRAELHFCSKSTSHLFSTSPQRNLLIYKRPAAAPVQPVKPGYSCSITGSPGSHPTLLASCSCAYS